MATGSSKTPWRLFAAAVALLCLAAPPALAASPPPKTPCEQGLARLKAKLKQGEVGSATPDQENSGARKHYRTAQMAHNAFDDPTCLSEIAKAEALLGTRKQP
jgi:hypothetical protein